MEPEQIQKVTNNLMEDKIIKTLEDVGIGKEFLNKTPKKQEIVPRVNERGQIKLKISVEQRK